MAADKFVVLVALLALALGPADSAYVITTPRRWTLNSESQVCVVLTEGNISPDDFLNYSLTEVWQKEVLLPETALVLPAGQSSACVEVAVPQTSDRLIRLDVTGSLNSESVNQSVNLTVVKETEKIFIQTDKYLYKPGQTIQFRILTVNGPDLNVSTENYEEVYINNPSRTRIAQWRNVSNPNGLVHLSFDLYDEIEEGTYTVGVKLMDKNSEEKIFRVEDYVLPRYEVTIDAPKNILGSDKSVTVTLCAKYTFGEPVKGVAELYLAAGQWRIYANLTETKNISGCGNFTFPTNELHFDDNNCHIRVNTLKANAKVTEDGTGVELLGSNHNIKVNRNAIKFKDETPSTTKKSYLPLSVKLATTYSDYKPATQEKMEVCTFFIDENICKNFTTDNQGYLNFVMPSQASSRIEVRAVNYPRIERNWNDVMEESKFYKYTYNTDEYVDVTNSSLTIFLENELQCTTGQDINFNLPIIYVVKDQPSADLFVQVISRGQVVSTKKVPTNFVETTLPFKNEEQLLPLETVPAGVVRGIVDIPMSLSARVSPKVKILVWYSTSDGIAVADSKEVEVTKCLPHNVQFGFSAVKAEPGTKTNLILSGSKDALCSVGVVDKSVELLSAENNKLDVESILQLAYNSEVATWDENQLDLEFCLQKYNISDTGSGSGGISPIITKDNVPADISFKRYSNVEAIHMFDKAGYYVISNLIMEKLFCDDLIISDLKSKVNQESPEIINRLGQREPAPQAFAAPVSGQSINIQPATFDSAVEADVSSPQTKEGVTEENQERSYLPETWLWLLTPLSSSGELNEPVTLPDTITEWVGKAVCVHPSEGVGISNASSIVTFTPFFVDLTLPSSVQRGETLPVKISIFNYLDEDLPVKVLVEPSENFQFVQGETGVRELCIPAKLKSVETINVTMTQIGDVNITTEAFTQPPSSGSCGSGTPPDKKDRFVRSLPVEPEGYTREKTFTKYICSQDVAAEGPVDTWNLEAPETIVEGSQRAWITAIGDLMGPTVENLGNLVQFPQGCGEQNMVNFAPNIYILQYLESSNQMTESIRAKLTKFLNSGYQRQLRFRRTPEGSYSTFGNIDKEGSTWLTAFVLKSLAQAKPYTLIDETTLKGTADWLKSLQKPDGCFQSKGRVVNKKLQGGIKGSEGSESLLTAYVLAALLEEGTLSESSSASAVKCIENDTSDHPYSLALKSYSLALAKAPSAKTVIDQLMGLALKNVSDLRWTLPDRRGESTSLHVETAAYALLALVTFDPKAYGEDSRKIVRWISGLRNGQGGFISTQDTVVALQALAAFEKAQPRESLNMTITATSPGSTNDFPVNEGNKFLQQRVDLSTLPATVNLSISGQGCSLAQGVLRYNVLADSRSDAFTLNVTTSEVPEKGCKTSRITACTSYTLPDNASNMAILEVKLVSGYIPLKQDLKDVIGDGSLAFKKYEVDGRKVTFYLEEVTSNLLCGSFRVYQDIAIENAKPGTVSIYDYYQPEFISTEKFSLTTTCPATA